MDKMDNVYARNRISGVVAAVPENHLDHPILGKNLDEVRSGKKRGRISEIVTDSPESKKDSSGSATRTTNVAVPDKDKDN
ncbi:hypothetical protein SEA_PHILLYPHILLY_45 [Microbacterium phage PhillyPhilly]|nr:hypothetical protein SEA_PHILLYPHILLY_45 [Microbacterium phage PhillyPhilly]